MLRFQNIQRDFAILEDLRDERVAKIYKERFKPFTLDDQEFFSRYRLDKIATRFLTNLLNIEEPRTNRGLPIPISLQVLTTLQFLGRNVHQTSVASIHGISQPSVGRVLKNISRKIALLSPHFIQFASSTELYETKRGFYHLAKFPDVIGVINCTHLHVRCPTRKFRDEMPRKSFYFLTVQIVCDADCKITDVTVSQGLKHDTVIWNECPLRKKLEFWKSEHSGVLLGNADYPSSEILLTPVRNPCTRKETRYNKSHAETRGRIEYLHRQFISKFRSIFERLRVDPNTATNIVLAIAVLHNIAKERNSAFLDLCPTFEAKQHTFKFNLNNDKLNQNNKCGDAYRTTFINEKF